MTKTGPYSICLILAIVLLFINIYFFSQMCFIIICRVLFLSLLLCLCWCLCQQFHVHNFIFLGMCESCLSEVLIKDTFSMQTSLIAFSHSDFSLLNLCRLIYCPHCGQITFNLVFKLYLYMPQFPPLERLVSMILLFIIKNTYLVFAPVSGMELITSLGYPK